MVRTLLIGLIRCYQKVISPCLPRSCRFWPSCSEYAIQAIETYGMRKGLLKASLRVLKCHPFHPGGYDPV
ncbi:MAG TPA: membrane protein insertion efficiency factor YidD [Deltaproteobacteria bacterium]|nr:membrane protein insertion efficiency factor YidD [Deltaproteobacteria bacterium]